MLTQCFRFKRVSMRLVRSISAAQDAIGHSKRFLSVSNKEPEKGKVFCSRNLPPNAVKLGNQNTYNPFRYEAFRNIGAVMTPSPLVLGLGYYFSDKIPTIGFAVIGLAYFVYVPARLLFGARAGPVRISAIYYCEDSSHIILAGPNLGLNPWGRYLIHIPPDCNDFEISTRSTGPSTLPEKARIALQKHRDHYDNLNYPHVYPVLDGLKLGSPFGKFGPHALIFLESISDRNGAQDKYIHLPSVKREVLSCQTKRKVFQKSLFGLDLMRKIRL